ncbi:hypothetical protein EPUL_003747 [Erysiphe pulchra]|uniref:Uncharacterized protein n=1 Tax=Erysiphe pulchra TaxID=225359 RepID=A0A2S4PMC9_9PEZI|nr:hypothetical protein EPUL_003747 [Erysiphe pulchra]
MSRTKSVCLAGLFFPSQVTPNLTALATAISSIESTIANFKEEIEKEEVAAFKAYLQLAIADFAAGDNSLTPPNIAYHSRPSKSCDHGLGKVKTAVEKVAVVIHRNTMDIDASLRKTQVARKGNKKARTSLSTKKIVVPDRKATQSVTFKDNSPTKDSPTMYERRKLSPAGICEVIKKLTISPALFGKNIPNAGNRLFLSKAKFESATNRTPVIDPTVPTTSRKEQGEVEVSKSMLTDEIERVCHIRPAHVKLYDRNKPGAPHRTWMAYFPTAPRSEETECFAQEICWALENALKAVGKRPNKKSGKSAPWWTSECKSAHLDYREAVDESECLIWVRVFRTTVASAKREHWTIKIEDMKSSRDTFKLMHWAAPRNVNVTLPLRHQGKFISDYAEQALVLRDSLLVRFSATDDRFLCI